MNLGIDNWNEFRFGRLKSPIHIATYVQNYKNLKEWVNTLFMFVAVQRRACDHKLVSLFFFLSSFSFVNDKLSSSLQSYLTTKTILSVSSNIQIGNLYARKLKLDETETEWNWNWMIEIHPTLKQEETWISLILGNLSHVRVGGGK